MAIQETIFNSTRYLTLRKSISTTEITNKEMYDEAGKKLGAYMAANGLNPTGPWTVLYFTWDEVNKKTDIGIAFPVASFTEVSDPELTLTDVPESKATMDVLHGDYDGLGAVHQGLMKYTREKGYISTNLPVIAVEAYEVGPMQDPNPANRITNIYYLHN